MHDWMLEVHAPLSCPAPLVMKTILIAVGGNSLIRAGEKGPFPSSLPMPAVPPPKSPASAPPDIASF